MGEQPDNMLSDQPDNNNYEAEGLINGLLGLMSHIVGKIEAASHQLDWAIRLVIDYNAPIPAITLAGAAEEMLGKSLGNISSHEKLVKIFASSHELDRKVVSQQHLNKARNWLKHWTPASEPEYETFDLLDEAVQGIARGLSNLLAYNRSLPSEGPRFIEWIKNTNKS